MYAWIWRHLPGANPVKALVSVVIVAAVAALLWFVVFPSADSWLPWGDVTVNSPQSPVSGP
jgi:hypothetical protein